MNAMQIDIATLARTGNIVRIPSVTFHEYIMVAAQYFLRDNDERMGQSYFNTLSVLRPDLAEQIRGTENDAFHDNNLLPAMLAVVYKKW